MAMKQSRSEGQSSGNSEDRPHLVRFYEAAYLFSKVVSYGIKQTEKNFLETKNYKTTEEFYDSYRVKAYFFTVITENLIRASRKIGKAKNSFRRMSAGESRYSDEMSLHKRV